MKKYFIVVFLMLIGQAGGAAPAVLAADEPAPLNNVIISELSPESSNSATEEFIELFNATDVPVSLAGWKVQYASASASSWTTKASWAADDTIVVQPGAYYLLATKDYLADSADFLFSGGMSASGGHVKLINEAGQIEDLVGWGNASAPLEQPVPAPQNGQSLARPLIDGVMEITNDNSADFSVTTQPTPKADNIITAPGNGNEDEGAVEGLTTSAGPYPTVEISELLPNPAAPQTDAEDEFVELYNPNSDSVDLSGYTITTGSTSSHKFTINNETVAPGGYIVFYSADTGLVLSNSGGVSKLLAPDGSEVDETGVYTEAPDGQSWIFANGQWQWTDTPTPGDANLFTDPATAKAAKASKTKKASAKKTTKSAKAKTVRAKNTSSNTAVPATATSQIKSLHPAVLAAVGTMAVLYALYEYRYDLANQVHRFRRYRTGRKISGRAN